jgi:hypothetical protein
MKKPVLTQLTTDIKIFPFSLQEAESRKLSSSQSLPALRSIPKFPGKSLESSGIYFIKILVYVTFLKIGLVL